MSFEAKKKRAIAIMESKNMWRSNYAPPLLRLAWKAGLKIPPLPFAPFWQITLLMGVAFALIWGVMMWFFSWKDTGVQPVDALVSGAVSGVFFGVSIAACHWWIKRVHDLPDWDSLGE